jgi:hypothetical protein
VPVARARLNSPSLGLGFRVGGVQGLGCRIVEGVELLRVYKVLGSGSRLLGTGLGFSVRGLVSRV